MDYPKSGFRERNSPTYRTEYMASAEQFLQLLEEKDLVSAQVLDDGAARDPADVATARCGGLVAVASPRPAYHRVAGGAAAFGGPTEGRRQTFIRPMAKGRAEANRSVESSNSLAACAAANRARQVAGPANTAGRTLRKRLAAGRDEPGRRPRPGSGTGAGWRGKKSLPNRPRLRRPPRRQKKTAAGAGGQAAAQPNRSKTASAAKPQGVDEKLESLDKKLGPLDSLVESEARESNQFDDPMSGPASASGFPEVFDPPRHQEYLSP